MLHNENEKCTVSDAKTGKNPWNNKARCETDRATKLNGYFFPHYFHYSNNQFVQILHKSHQSP